jgi:hypothetical protein
MCCFHVGTVALALLPRCRVSADCHFCVPHARAKSPMHTQTRLPSPKSTQFHPGCCPTGACAAPRGIGTRGRPFWKLAALDYQLDTEDNCNPSLRLSTLLRPTNSALSQSRVLDLWQYDASAADYLLALDMSSALVLAGQVLLP